MFARNFVYVCTQLCSRMHATLSTFARNFVYVCMQLCLRLHATLSTFARNFAYVGTQLFLHLHRLRLTFHLTLFALLITLFALQMHTTLFVFASEFYFILPLQISTTLSAFAHNLVCLLLVQLRNLKLFCLHFLLLCINCHQPLEMMGLLAP